MDDHLTFRYRNYLVRIAILLVAVGVLGWSGLLNRAAVPAFWFSPTESAIHFGLGLGLLLLVFVRPLAEWASPAYHSLVVALGGAMFAISVYGFLFGNAVGLVPPEIMNLQLSHNLLHLIMAETALNALSSTNSLRPRASGMLARSD